MSTSASVSYLSPKFNDFLFAHINEDKDATPLSVLSMLARLGVDPWEEAAKLARLPRLAAANRLVEFIASTPGCPSAYLNAETVSKRLIDLLPSPAGVAILPRKERVVRAFAIPRFKFLPVVIAVILAILLIVLSLQGK
jgi:hypothetical protein